MNEQTPDNNPGDSRIEGSAQSPSPPAPPGIEDIFDHVSTNIRYTREIQAQLSEMSDQMFWLGVVIAAATFYLLTARK